MLFLFKDVQQTFIWYAAVFARLTLRNPGV